MVRIVGDKMDGNIAYILLKDKITGGSGGTLPTDCLTKNDVAHNVKNDTDSNQVLSVGAFKDVLELLYMQENKDKEYIEIPLSLFNQYMNTTTKSCYYSVRHGICELHLEINCKKPSSTRLLINDKLPLIPETRSYYLKSNNSESSELTVILEPDTTNKVSKLYVCGGTEGQNFYEQTIFYFV